MINSVKSGDYMLAFTAALETEREKSEFMRLYEENKDKMYYIAYTKLGNRFDAEDAVYEAFARAAGNFRKILEIDCKKRGAYLDVIVRNVAVDMLRNRKKQAAPAEPDDNSPLCAVSLEDEVVGKIGEERLMDFISALPETQREILELTSFCDMEYSEAAAFLGISENTAYQRIFRARKAILDFIGRENNG